MTPNYTPYGPEWEKELMKLSKKVLIEMIRRKALSAIGEGEWINAEDRKPLYKEGEDYSENVLAVVKGNKHLFVMCWTYQEGVDKTNSECNGPVWANCYGDIAGDAEWDDNYEVTHWQPLPNPPSLTK